MRQARLGREGAEGAEGARRLRISAEARRVETNPAGLAGLVRLRGEIGNREVVRLLAAQARLDVGRADDPLEAEADRAAADVVRALRTPVTSTVEDPGVLTVRRRVAAPMGPEGGEVGLDLQRSLDAARTGGAPLPNRVEGRMEAAFGADFSHVRLHAGPVAANLNREMGATAFTVGRDVFFRDRLPNTGSPQDQHLLAHELAHTVQQGAASRPRRAIARPGVDRVPAGTTLVGEGGGQTAEPVADVEAPEGESVAASIFRQSCLLPDRGLARRVEARTRPRVQRRDTLAVVLPTVAEKIYKNAVKGDPPFKPQKGNYGHVSWFKGKGDPWIGGATGGGNSGGSNVTVDVTMPEPTSKPPDYFNTTIQNLEHLHHLDRTKKEHGGTLWRLLGQSLEGDDLAEISIPKDKFLNSQAPGTFITAGASGRDKVKLKDFVALQNRVDPTKSLSAAISKKVKDPAEFTMKVNPEDQAKVGALRVEIEASDSGFQSKVDGSADKLAIAVKGDEVTVSGAIVRVRNIAKNADALAKVAGLAKGVTKTSQGLTVKAQVGHNAPVTSENLSARIQGSKTRTGMGAAMLAVLQRQSAPIANDIAALVPVLPAMHDALTGMTALWNTWNNNHRASAWNGKYDYSWHGDELKLIVPVMVPPKPGSGKTKPTKGTTTISHTFTNIDL
jgi:hypothetical protein